MADTSQTYVFVATAAESLGLSTTEVMDLVASNTLAHAMAEGIVLIDVDSLTALTQLQQVPA